MNIANAISYHGRARPEHPALIEGDRVISYAMLDREVEATAQKLAAAGVRRGDRIGLCLKERPEFLVALFAVARRWAIVVAVDWRAPDLERRRISEALGLKLMICEPGAAGSLACAIEWPTLQDLAPAGDAAEPAFTESDAPFLIALSSGTTGKPKGFVISHCAQFLRMTRLHIDLQYGYGIRYFSATPLVHASGRNKCIDCLVHGGTVILYPPLYRPEELVEAVARFQGTHLYLVPTVLRRLLELASAERPLFAGAPHLTLGAGPTTPDERFATLQRLSPNTHVSYGAAAYMTIASLGPEDIRAKTVGVGRPTFMTEVEVVDESGLPLPRDREGILRCRGPGNCSEVIGLDSTADQTEMLHDGWYYPGDIGRISPEGIIQLVGRTANRIKRAGVSIVAEEVERILCQHPGVAEAAVVGRPSRELGQDVVAFVILRVETSPDALLAHCRRNLAGFKVPSKLHIVQSFPRSAVGKVVKRALLEKVIPPDALAGQPVDEYR